MLQLPDNFATYDDMRREGFIRICNLKEQGKKVVGTFCSYTPLELIRAAGAVPVGLCGCSEEGISDAEKRLPKNLCPLIKSSYGLALSGKCPYFYFADAILAETTCDGKKKMYELMNELKPVHVMQLPPGREAPGALALWRDEMVRAKDFLQQQLQCHISEDAIRQAIAELNRQRQAVLRLYDLGKLDPCPLSGYELATVINSSNYIFDIEDSINALESKVAEQLAAYAKIEGTKDNRPRLMISGCPFMGVIDKVVKAAEEMGASVVAFDSCCGPRTQIDLVDEDKNKDVYLALAEKYLRINCSVMSPNSGRFAAIREMIAEYKIDAVIEIVLQSCHTFAIEADRVKNLARRELGIPYLYLETDFSTADTGQINTRIGALLEIAAQEK